MIKVIIVDDESLARKLVKSFLADHADIEIMDECANGFDAMKAIQKHKPDLVFLDVQMPKLDGFELLELLDPAPEIIFTTAFDQYAIKAFDKSAVDYLLKPFDKVRFSRAISKFRERQSNKIPAQVNSNNKLLDTIQSEQEEIERIAVKSGSEIRIIPINNIRYLEAYDDYVKIFTPDDMFLKKQTLSYYEQVLPQEQFVRIHRSVLLNIQELNRIEQAEKENHWVILKDQTRLNVSRSGYQKLRQSLNL
ncbi:MAG: response regulator [Bacteroidetes bacterium]|nr:response regulator [Bacteroidota bacterium]